MKQCKPVLLLLSISMLIMQPLVFAQEPASHNEKLLNFSERWIEKVDVKSEDIIKRLISQSEKYLRRMSGHERKLRKVVSRTDSIASERIFVNAATQYAILHKKITELPGRTAGLKTGYLPHLDSLQTAFNFLRETGALNEMSPQTDVMLKEAIGKLDMLQEKFSQAEMIAQFIRQREQFLHEQLGAYGLNKAVKKLQRQVYYYQAQVDEYKRTFEHPSLLEAKALAILRKTSLFTNYFRKHSQLAGMFRVNETSEDNSIAAFAGFQTREAVQQQLLQRFGSLPDFEQIVRVKKTESPPGQLKNNFKNQVNNQVIGSSNIEQPDFNPNLQKVKSFKNRLEFGTNLQTVKSNRFFPSTSDLALSVGYKMNDKSIIGIAGSYKLGWGKDIRHIAFTHQGIGLRSFMDFKIKGNLWLSGGAEMNYKSRFSDFELLKQFSPWQKSALLGVSKKYKVSKKLRGNMQLMVDFLYKQQVPQTQPLLFRIGHTL